ncbi:hypothetical protein [Pseudomonas sp. B19125]|uniref:hypothetical protein n=1 Tax=Pseudomonas sp. B19125 TaxID=3235109 RepID=UPI003785266F
MEAKELWDDLNKIGTVLTIVGFFLTVVTMFLALYITSALRRKVRVPETFNEIKQLISEMRLLLKKMEEIERTDGSKIEMGEHQRDISVYIHRSIAYVQNIRPKLESLQRKSADELISLMAEKKGLIRRGWVCKKLSTNQAWDVHDKLHSFSVHLETLIRDRSAGGV